MVFPAIMVIGKEDIVEHHGAEPQHDEFSDTPNSESCVKSIILQRLPSGALLIAESSDILT